MTQAVGWPLFDEIDSVVQTDEFNLQAKVYDEGDQPASQPTMGNVLKHFTNRRTITADDKKAARFAAEPTGHGFGALFGQYETLPQLRTAVFELLTERLSQKGIKSRHLVEEIFGWALPRSLSQINDWRALLAAPVTISPSHLRTMLNLQPSNSVNPNHDVLYSFYIRTFAFTRNQFEIVLNTLMKDSYDMNDKLYMWVELLQSPSFGAQRDWYIRYCGMTANDPWTRHMNDLSTAKTKPKSWFFRFLQITTESFPKIIRDAEVDVVKDATIAVQLADEDINLREQILIALFGPGVANMQIGGADILLHWNDGDDEVFGELKTKTAIQLITQLKDCSKDTKNSVHHYGMKVKRYATEPGNRSLTGTDKQSFTICLLRCIVRQATPAILQRYSCALFTTIGSDIGQDSHTDNTFYESGRRSAQVVNAMFDQFDFWEKPFGTTFAPGATRRMSASGYLPFIDLFAWFRKDRLALPEATRLTNEYLLITKPLIILAYGTLPSAFALNNSVEMAADCYHRIVRQEGFSAGTNAGYFSEIVGRPQLRTIGADGEPVIIIPSYHPGFLAQAGLPAAKSIRVFSLCHQVVWSALNIALTMYENNPNETRIGLCRRIVEKIEDQLAVDTTFGMNFASAKLECAEITRTFYRAQSKRKVVRRQDLTKRKKKSDRKEKIGYMSNRKTQFVAMGKGSSTSIGRFPLYIASTSLGTETAPKADRDRNLLTWEEPTDIESDLTEETTSWTIGPLVLPGGVTEEPGPLYISYTCEGMDIVNSKDYSVGENKPIASGNCRTCCLPISTIILHITSQDEEEDGFLEHWQEVTGVQIDSLLTQGAETSAFSVQEYYPKSFFDFSPTAKSMLVPGVQYLHKTMLENYVKLVEESCLPTNPADFLWLMARFLSELTDHDGETEIDTASTSETDTSVWKLVAQFCQRPLYQFHPYRQTLMALVHLTEMGIAQRCMANNVLLICISVCMVERQKKSKTLKFRSGSRTVNTSRVIYWLKNDFRLDIFAPFIEPVLQHETRPIFDTDEFIEPVLQHETQPSSDMDDGDDETTEDEGRPTRRRITDDSGDDAEPRPGPVRKRRMVVDSDDDDD